MAISRNPVEEARLTYIDVQVEPRVAIDIPAQLFNDAAA